MQQSVTVIPFNTPSPERVAKRAIARAKARARKGSWKLWVKKNDHKLKKPAQYNLKHFTTAV